MIYKRLLPSRFWPAAFCAMAAMAPAHAREPKPDPRGEAELSKLLAGRVAGKPTDCIGLHSSDDSQVIDHTAIVYHDGGTLWVNRPVGGLGDLDDNTTMVTKLYTSQLCSVDIVHLVDRTAHFERGFLSLGKFVPYTRQR
jgi:hypothetical protein